MKNASLTRLGLERECGGLVRHSAISGLNKLVGQYNLTGLDRLAGQYDLAGLDSLQ